jgi:hypothetical protein
MKCGYFSGALRLKNRADSAIGPTYTVEGSGQLCPLCYQELYGVAPILQSVYERDLGKQPEREEK